MNRHWNKKAVAYLACACVGLVGTWTANVMAIVQQRNFVGDWITSGPAVASLTLDILIVAIVAAVFIVIEGRRLGMRWLVVYLLLIPFVALAFALPLFLAMRERALLARGVEPRSGFVGRSNTPSPRNSD